MSNKSDTLVEILVKETIEKKIAELRQQVKDEGRRFLEVAANLRASASTLHADTFVSAIDALQQQVEENGEKLLKKLANLTFPAQTERELVTSPTKNAENIIGELDNLLAEKQMLFSKADNELKSLGLRVICALVEHELPFIQKVQKDVTARLPEIKLLALAVKVNTQLAEQINTLEQFVAESAQALTTDCIRLSSFQLHPAISEVLASNELEMFPHKVDNFLQEVKNRLDQLDADIKPFVSAKQQRQKMLRIIVFSFLVIFNCFIYYSYSLEEKILLPGIIETMTWVITGIFLITINTFCIIFIESFVTHLALKYELNKKRMTNFLSIIIYDILVALMAFLFYTILLPLTYSFLYPVLVFMASNSPIILVIEFVAALAVIPSIIKSSWKLLRKMLVYIPNK